MDKKDNFSPSDKGKASVKFKPGTAGFVSGIKERKNAEYGAERPAKEGKAAYAAAGSPKEGNRPYESSRVPKEGNIPYDSSHVPKEGNKPFADAGVSEEGGNRAADALKRAAADAAKKSAAEIKNIAYDEDTGNENANVYAEKKTEELIKKAADEALAAAKTAKDAAVKLAETAKEAGLVSPERNSDYEAKDGGTGASASARKAALYSYRNSVFSYDRKGYSDKKQGYSEKNRKDRKPREARDIALKEKDDSVAFKKVPRFKKKEGESARKPVPIIRKERAKDKKSGLKYKVKMEAGELMKELVFVLAPVLPVILVFALMAQLLLSPMGILFSSDSTLLSDMTVSDAVRDINADFSEKIEEIKGAYTYDAVKVTGARAPWREVLAVYAVLNSRTGESVTMNEGKREVLKEVFWAMNAVSCEVRTVSTDEAVTSGTGADALPSDFGGETAELLEINVSASDPYDAAEYFGFSAKEKRALEELLGDEYKAMFSSVIYSFSSTDDIVGVALSQIGNIGGEPYWSWYGYESRVEWCACFVSWCASECGYIDEGTVPKFDNCQIGASWFKEKGAFIEGPSADVSAGMIIFFDWQCDGISDHVGVVQSADENYVYTVEGNSGDCCRTGAYALTDARIYGYGIIEA